VAPLGDVNNDGWADLIVGAPDYSYSHTAEGAAFAFYGGPDMPSQTAGWNDESNWNESNLGFSVAAAGDVNGDGYADVVVGAPYYDSSYSNEGAVLMYFGSSTGLPSAADWFARGEQADANFGYSVASAGDINGDGYSDVVIGAPYYDYSAVDGGAIFVFEGDNDGMGGNGSPATADWFAIGGYGGGLMGYSTCGAGDVNGDGFADVAGGAPNYDDGGFANEGAVFLWHGSASGLGTTGEPSNADWHDAGGVAGRGLGTSLSSAGDVNWDGYSDLIAGGLDIAVVWHGSVTGLNPSGIDWAMSQGNTAYLFGRSVSSAGDINGDGFSDVVVGAPTYTRDFANEGAAWAYCGSSAGLGTAFCWWDTGYRQDAYLGMSVASAGDLNGDGYTEIAIGVPGWSNPQSSEGQARLYFGSEWGPVSFNDGDWTVESNFDDAILGRSIAGVGDVNGDGYGDLIVGAAGFSNGQTDEGRVSLYFGNRAGVSIVPRHISGNHTSPIAPDGLSDSENDFSLKILARNASGRSKVGFRAQVAASGNPFTGSTLSIAPANPGQVGGISLIGDVTGLSKDTAYHWRTRIINSKVDSPYSPPTSRWFHLNLKGSNESVLRTAGTASGSGETPLFADNFESGDLSAWDSSSP
jgi:hypothetical protein